MISLRSAFVVALLVPSSAMAGFNLVANGSFEDPNLAPTITDGVNPPIYKYERLAPNQFTGWTHAQGAPLIEGAPGGWAAADGEQFTEVESGFAQSFTQSIFTTPGQAYEILFAVAADPFAGNGPDDTLIVRWGGQSVATIDQNDTTTQDLEWVWHTLSVVATSQTTELKFEDGVFGNSFVGAYIDGIFVYEVPAPGVASSAMLIGLASLRRRR